MFTVLAPAITSSVHDELAGRILLLRMLDSFINAQVSRGMGQHDTAQWIEFRAQAQRSRVDSPVTDPRGESWGVLTDLFI